MAAVSVKRSIERDRISAINFETAQLHILSDVLVAVA